jgi:N-acetylglutamate synthase-like GNAT family acetyltransferase
MSEAKIRRAVQSDLDTIYMMGFDAWAENSSESQYLEACRSSPKYKRGTWYVLEDSGSLLCSLIVYEFSPLHFGIGSIATPKVLRRKGHASDLISKIVAELERNRGAKILFLYSDISPEFYEKFGFRRVPPEMQKYKTTTCMARGSDIQRVIDGKVATPEYF